MHTRLGIHDRNFVIKKNQPKPKAISLLHWKRVIRRTQLRKSQETNTHTEWRKKYIQILNQIPRWTHGRDRKESEKIVTFVFNPYPEPTHTVFPEVHKEINETHACAPFCLYQIYIVFRNPKHELLKELEAITNKKQWFWIKLTSVKHMETFH